MAGERKPDIADQAPRMPSASATSSHGTMRVVHRVTAFARGMDLMKFGKRLQRERERRGLTQRELGLKVGLTSGTYISQIESGEKTPPLETVIKLANALGLTDAVPFVFHAVRERSAVEYGFLSSRIKPSSPGKAELCTRPLPVRPWASVIEGNLPAGIEGSSADPRCIVLEGFGDADAFAIEISTDWMADTVCRGDVVVVSPGREVTSGDIALVRVTGKRGSNVEEIKIARAYFRGRWTDLVPGTLSRYPVETYPSRDITVLGKVVARLSHL
ncbi:MAG: helix-turn-helix protein [Candidatus Latescibacteria bacterium ADurb.Bin168]|nr:MAG: helix-turn-helix protein [Candidatus Latescibacteria bacterium ADurb.Bin168]